MSSVYVAQEKRLAAWKDDIDWPELMAIRLLIKQSQKVFRWFDSGDLQSVKMLEDICKVCTYTDGYLRHWLPTQERKFLKECTCDIPENLNIRVSSTQLEQKQDAKDYTNSFVVKEPNVFAYTCPSKNQGGKCKECRACWDRNVSHVAYLQH
jgi:hypothetical protein